MSDTEARDRLAQIIEEHYYDGRSGWISYEARQKAEERMATAILAAGWRPPVRVVATREELEALPEESIILDAGVPAYLLDGLWSYPADQSDYEAGEIKLPVTVLYEPEEGE